MENSLTDDVAAGRGAQSNRVGRFEPYARVAVDDGWDSQIESVPRTQVAVEAPHSVITRNTSPYVPFDRSVNPYRGCEHGCITVLRAPDMRGWGCHRRKTLNAV